LYGSCVVFTHKAIVSPIYEFDEGIGVVENLRVFVAAFEPPPLDKFGNEIAGPYFPTGYVGVPTVVVGANPLT
jgi:hypothetical protein